MKLNTFFSVLAAAAITHASPCSTGTQVFLTDVVCVKATCASIQGTEVDANGTAGAIRTLRTGAFQVDIRETLEFWEERCKTNNIPTPCVDGDYCVDSSNTVIGYPQYSH